LHFSSYSDCGFDGGSYSFTCNCRNATGVSGSPGNGFFWFCVASQCSCPSLSRPAGSACDVDLALAATNPYIAFSNRIDGIPCRSSNCTSGQGLLCAPKANSTTEYTWQCFTRPNDPPQFIPPVQPPVQPPSSGSATPSSPSQSPVVPPVAPAPTLPRRGPVVPILNCWEPDAAIAGNIKAFFGYDNRNPADILIPVGTGNRFQPSPESRTQPTVFLPGVKQLFFSVSYPQTQSLTWTIDASVSVNINDQSTRCPQGTRAFPFLTFSFVFFCLQPVLRFIKLLQRSKWIFP
jgi:hypothetical protein